MAGTNNFKVFDENQANMMADTDYANSADRANGVYDGLADPTLSNKTWYQSSIMAAAIAGLAADKGVNISDTSLTELKASILSSMAYQTAGGTATIITLTLPALVNGYSVTFVAAANNNGAATTVNGIPLYKPGTTTAPTLVAGKAYTICLAGAGIVALAGFIYKKYHGYLNYTWGAKLAEAAITAIKSYVAAHPDVAAAAETIFNLFAQRLTEVLPLNDAEVVYLFEQIETALAELLGVDVSFFASVKADQLAQYKGKKISIFGGKKLLFS